MPSVYQNTHPTAVTSKVTLNTITEATTAATATFAVTTTSTYVQTDDTTMESVATLTTATTTDPTYLPIPVSVPLDTQVEILKFLTLHGDAVYKEKAMHELMALATQR